LNAIAKDVFEKNATCAGLTVEKTNELWAWFEQTFWNEQELVGAIEPQLPEIRALVEVWGSTTLKHLSLTAVGIAIGYANLCRVCPDFKAELSTWIN
jgi:hypothetical protein